MKLLPKTAHAYDEYFNSIRAYNIWFVKLRWFAAAAVLFYWIAIEFIFGFSITHTQRVLLILIAVLIAGYNYFFYSSLNSKSTYMPFTQLDLSLQQIILDLTGLSIIIYVSGGLESPLFLFYIFHMIIGSLILPSAVMYLAAGILIFMLSAFSISEYLGIIPHYGIYGLLPFTQYDNPAYIAGVLIIFASAVLISVMLTSKIASELYGRERQLKTALDELNESEIRKQKYVMSVVHELKSPVAASVSQMDLVLGNYAGKIDDGARDKIKNARDRSSKAIAMINDILHISKFKLFNDVQKLDLNLLPLIKNAAENILPIAERKNIGLNYKSNVIDERQIKADPVLLNLALSNLIGNAVKYTMEGGEVNIFLEDEANFKVIKITDNGIGIPKEEHGKIFNEYYRASNVGSSEGTGMGLAFVKQIIQSHGGTIKLISPAENGNSERPGSEFIISIPFN